MTVETMVFYIAMAGTVAFASSAVLAVAEREVFYSLREAQILIEQWRRHYNTVRPHSALGYRPPAPESIIPMVQTPVMH